MPEKTTLRTEVGWSGNRLGPGSSRSLPAAHSTPVPGWTGSAVGLRRPLAKVLCSPVCGSICHTTARSTSAFIPRSVMLLLEPMPTYRNRLSSLAASDLVKGWLILAGRSPTLTGAPPAFVWSAVYGHFPSAAWWARPAERRVGHGGAGKVSFRY